VVSTEGQGVPQRDREDEEQTDIEPLHGVYASRIRGAYHRPLPPQLVVKERRRRSNL
jgi:hypothetical protein